MCQILVCQKRKPTMKELQDAEATNKDGCGIAFRLNGRNVYIKGLNTVEQIFNISQRAPLPQVIHFRRGTNGGIIPELTHPFIVTERDINPLKYSGKLSLLFHNGHDGEAMKTICALKKRQIPEVLSDSRAIAMITSMVGKNALLHFSGKFVLFTTSDIYCYGDFTDRNDIKYSSSPFYSSYLNGLDGFSSNRSEWRWLINDSEDEDE